MRGVVRTAVEVEKRSAASLAEWLAKTSSKTTSLLHHDKIFWVKMLMLQ
jgi:hypothetical protein